MAGEPSFQHLLDFLAHEAFVAGDNVGFLFNEQRDVRVLLETVADTVEVKVKALLLQFFQAGHDGRAVEVRADADGEQFGLADARRQHVGFFCTFATKSAKGIH